jgi:predicted dehydrogenase
MSDPRARPLGVGIVGCGNISRHYADSVSRYAETQLIGVHDQDPAAAGVLAGAAGCEVFATLDELLADPRVDVVANLTNPPAHYAVSRQALSARRHVYSEKPLALGYEDAASLVRLAEETGARLGCSPSVWLAPAPQAAWREVASGRLGTVRVVHAEMDQARIERWHPAPAGFFAIGPVADAGIYPLALLTAIFGPVRSVTAHGTIVMPERTTVGGTPFRVPSPDYVVVLFEIDGGPLVRLTCNFYVAGRQSVEIHGDLASVRLDSSVRPWAAVHVASYGGEYEPVDLPDGSTDETDFAIGLRDMVQAIAEGRPHRATGEHAAHLVEVLNAVTTSIETQRTINVTSSFDPPSPAGWEVAAAPTTSAGTT